LPIADRLIHSAIADRVIAAFTNGALKQCGNAEIECVIQQSSIAR
jgi:hypothetical protein